MSHATQFGGQRLDGTCEVVIGLDFGTSCTKVVLRTPNHFGGPAWAIPFGDAAHALSPYLLPSSLWMGQDGRVSLGPEAGGSEIRDLKRRLMQAAASRTSGAGAEVETTDCHIAAISYLALVLRHARNWFLRNQRKLYGGFTLHWALNLGLPSADYADRALCRSYRRVAEAAWCMSLADAPITLNRAQMALEEADGWNPEDEQYAEIAPVPEVAAEVAGYARSHLREEGLHVLVDIGAGTLDVCGFILHETDGEDRYELLTADVRELGAMVLYRDRIFAVQSASAGYFDELESRDAVEPILNDASDYVPPHKSLVESLEESDARYQRWCLRMLWETIVSLRMRRDPRSPRWQSMMPVFLCGGASRMLFYQSLLDDVSDDMKRMYRGNGCRGINSLTLPRPKNLYTDIGESQYQRLAVAWGLSYPEIDIGEVTRPENIQDVEERRDHREPNFIGKELI